MPSVLSIQSRVAYGHVGNAAATLPLQLLGCEAWTLDTVLFSNHTGHGRWRGNVVPASEVAAVFEGVADLGVLPECDAVLSGYLGEAATGAVLIDAVDRIKRANPAAVFCCDPVMGDIDSGLYVRAGLPEFFRDTALPAADIATPNRFELEWLTGEAVTSLPQALAAAERLRRTGPDVVLITSLDTATDHIGMVAVGPAGAWLAETPRLPLVLNGCGDVTAAVFLARLLRGDPLPQALGATMAGVFAVLETTLRLGRRELALVPAQAELATPSRVVEARRIA
ncbi:MAG: pyridoxal kinase PdxY [Alphaproteobacteria bacterium]|nr:pyridoxal kinase PdxY [Alphaproteobacteria bacterium]